MVWSMLGTDFSLGNLSGYHWLQVGHTLIAATNAQAGTVPEVNVIEAVFQSFVLGIVQGITEFLPISSTAHLLVFTKLLGWETTGQKTFVDAIQFGSVIAVVWYFWKDIRQILTGAWDAFQRKEWHQEEWKIFVGIAVGTIPALGIGFVLKKLKLLPDGILVIAVM